VIRPRAGRLKAAMGNSFVFSKPSKLTLPHTEAVLVQYVWQGLMLAQQSGRGVRITIQLRQVLRLPKRALVTCTGTLPSHVRLVSVADDAARLSRPPQPAAAAVCSRYTHTRQL
jgi:hypothetical protein